MQLSRRKFLNQIAATGVIASSFGLLSCTKKKTPWLVSACSDKGGEHYVAAVDLTGNIVSQIKLPARGHDAIGLPHKPGRAVIFARRPGRFALEVDFISGKIVKHIASSDLSHFYGHGVYSSRYRTLLTSENDIASGNGLIVVRDADNYQELARYSSGGIGPHEIALMPDGDTLVIANGGIKTHPDFPRRKLNIDSMVPNLSYLSLKTGAILDSYQLENNKLSIRHLAVSQSGKVVAGLQYQGVKTDLVPLAFAHAGEASLSILQADADIWRQMNQYTASICIDDDKQIAAISCPRADLITYWSLKDNQFITKQKLADGAGLTNTGQMFATSGKGLITNNLLINTSSPFSTDQNITREIERLKWDNHLTYIEPV